MENEKLKDLIDTLSQGTTILTPLELNDIRFSDKKTVITPESLKRMHPSKAKNPQKES